MLTYQLAKWYLSKLYVWTLTKRQEADMDMTKLKIYDFRGVTRMDKFRNEYIRGTAQVGQFG